MIKIFLILVVAAGGYWVYTHPSIVTISPRLSVLTPKVQTITNQAQEFSEKGKEAATVGAEKAKEYAVQAKEDLTKTGEGIVKGAQVGIYDQAVAVAEKALSSVAKSLGIKTDETSPLSNTSKTQNIAVDVGVTPAPEEVVQVCSISTPGKQVEFGLKLSSASQATYAATVEWGDQTKATALTLTGQKVETVAHVYQSAGTYTITIRAAAEGKEYISYKTLCVN